MNKPCKAETFQVNKCLFMLQKINNYKLLAKKKEILKKMTSVIWNHYTVCKYSTKKYRWICIWIHIASRCHVSLILFKSHSKCYLLHTTNSAEMTKFGLRRYTQSIVQDSYLSFQFVIRQCCILWCWNPRHWLGQWYAVNSCCLLSTHSCSCGQLLTSGKQNRPDHFYKMTSNWRLPKCIYTVSQKKPNSCACLCKN